MKKLLFAFVLLVASCGAFADDFDDLAALYQRNAARLGWGFQANYKRRVLYFDIKFTERVKAFTRKDLEDFKREFIQSFRKGAGPGGIARMKRARATMVINLVMADGYKYKVSIPWYEL